MWRYSLRRLAGAIPTLFIVMRVAFFMMRLAPGGPFDRDRMLTPEIEANIRQAYNLDEPLVVQYGIYVSKLLRGDLGPSFKYQDYTVVELIGNGFPVSFGIGSTAIMLALLVGGAFGIFAALRQNSLIDHAVMAVAMIGITVPNFVMAPLMALIIGVWLRLLPAGGYGGGRPRNPIPPTIPPAPPPVAHLARPTPPRQLEVPPSDYLHTPPPQRLPARCRRARSCRPLALAGCPCAPCAQSRRRREPCAACRHCAHGGAGAMDFAAPIRRSILGRRPHAARLRQSTLVRHRRQRPRPVRPHPLWRPCLAPGGRGGDHGEYPDWRHLRLHRGLFLRSYRSAHDAPRRRTLLSVAPVLWDAAGRA